MRTYGDDPTAGTPQVVSGLREVERVGKFVLGSVFAALFIFSASASITGVEWQDFFHRFFRSMSMGGITCLASAMVGSILGFLFGIPKVLQKMPDAAQPQSNLLSPDVASRPPLAPFFTTNTSLEEISDWLTKIIIGLGMVQFTTIIQYMFNAAALSYSFVEGKAFSVDQLGSSPVSGAVAFFFALIVVCLLGSCLFAYLETRTRLTLMFLNIEKNKLNVESYRDALDRPVTSEPDTNLGVSASSQPSLETTTDVDEALLRIPRDQLKSATEIAGWASAQARAGNIREAEYALRDAVQRDPGNFDVLLRLAELFALQGDRRAHVNAVLELIKRDPKHRGLIPAARSAQYEALYLPPPDGFNKAIEVTMYLEGVKANMRPAVQLRRACAFGQRFKYLGSATSEESRNARAEALASAKHVVRLEQEPEAPIRMALKRVYDPKRFGGSEMENDLEVFLGDPEFEAVIVQGNID